MAEIFELKKTFNSVSHPDHILRYLSPSLLKQLHQERRDLQVLGMDPKVFQSTLEQVTDEGKKFQGLHLFSFDLLTKTIKELSGVKTLLETTTDSSSDLKSLPTSEIITTNQELDNSTALGVDNAKDRTLCQILGVVQDLGKQFKDHDGNKLGTSNYFKSFF